MWGCKCSSKGKMEFCKRGFGERRYSSLERALRGEAFGVIVAGHDGVGGGDRLFWWKKEEEDGDKVGVVVVVVVEMEEEM